MLGRILGLFLLELPERAGELLIEIDTFARLFGSCNAQRGQLDILVLLGSLSVLGTLCTPVLLGGLSVLGIFYTLVDLTILIVIAVVVFVRDISTASQSVTCSGFVLVHGRNLPVVPDRLSEVNVSSNRRQCLFG